MQTRRLGNSDLELTTIGLGTWAIGGPWAFGWGKQDDADSIATIQKAIDCGINWIDTAAVYGLGHSEEIVGQAIKGRRDELIIATKCGLVWDSSRKVGNNLEAASVRAEAESSLRRLDIDVIDLYQIHWPIPPEQIEFAWEEMARLKEEGKIRFAGVSNLDAGQMRRLQSIMPITSLQPPYSMVRRDIESDILPFCRDNTIGVVAYSPMQSGLLTGKYNAESIAALPDDDWRKSKNREFAEPHLTPNLELVGKLSNLAEEEGKTITQLAIAWVLAQKGVTSAIVGMRRPDQVDPILPAGDWTLSADVLARMGEWIAERDAALPNDAGATTFK